MSAEIRGRPAGADSSIILWAVELSPFALKLASMFEWAELSYRWLPGQGRRFENVLAAIRINWSTLTNKVIRHGGNHPLDEFPQVPFLITPDRNVHYDSSAIADWIDAEFLEPGGTLLPRDPVMNWIVRFIDEAFDEFGLYMVHHNRWVLAAGDNDAGERLAAEFSNFLPRNAAKRLGRSFPKRQVRRLPYLLSVAKSGLEMGLPKALTPPSREGFPETHALLESAWHQYLDALELLLESQPFLLGAHFTLADASAYGQLSMNLTDAGGSR